MRSTNEEAGEVLIWIVGWGAILSLGALAIGGVYRGLGAAGGAALAALNWGAFVRLGSLFRRRPERRNLVLTLVALKFFAWLILCTLVVAFVPIDRLGFLIGVSSLPVGLISGMLRELKKPREAY